MPVADEIGGVVIYMAGRAAYYVLNGEWFEAVQDGGVPRVDPYERRLIGSTVG